MTRPLRVFLGLAGIILITALLSILTTILLFPFWSWFEKTTGIESVGHSGPAEWCYAAAFLLLAVSAVWLLLVRRRN
jgi:H+/Cl- antiporter ClcA